MFFPSNNHRVLYKRSILSFYYPKTLFSVIIYRKFSITQARAPCLKMAMHYPCLALAMPCKQFLAWMNTLLLIQPFFLQFKKPPSEQYRITIFYSPPMDTKSQSFLTLSFSVLSLVDG